MILLMSLRHPVTTFPRILRLTLDALLCTIRYSSRDYLSFERPEDNQAKFNYKPLETEHILTAGSQSNASTIDIDISIAVANQTIGPFQKIVHAQT